MGDRNQRPIAVNHVRKQSCQLLDCLQTSTYRLISSKHHVLVNIFIEKLSG